MNKKPSNTIRARILYGYFRVIALIVVLVLSSLCLLTVTEYGYRNVNDYRNQQCTAQEVITAHYKWLDSLNASILNGVAFDGGLDPNTCSLGQWLNSTDPHAMNDAEISSALEDIIAPHKEIHAAASELIELSKTDRDSAYDQYTSEVRPKVVRIGAGLAVISGRYEAIAKDSVTNMSRMVKLSYILCAGLGLLAILLAIRLGTRISKRIAAPIVSVAKWSQEMATGVENLKMDDNAAEKASDILEIKQMIQAFQDMAKSIRRNVDVIKRVAEGDLTAFVDIRSDGDSLGSNLYHLVQNNDMMFARLLKVADSVAENAGNIAKASQSLAESATNQADAVEGLSSTVDLADTLAQDNAVRANMAAEVSGEIRQEIQ